MVVHNEGDCIPNREVDRPMSHSVRGGVEFKRQWQRLPLRKRLAIRWAVSRGRILEDPRQAALGAGLARRWLGSFWLTPVGIGLQILLVAAVATVAWLLLVPGYRWFLLVGLFFGLGGGLSARHMFKEAERANREVAERGFGPNHQQ